MKLLSLIIVALIASPAFADGSYNVVTDSQGYVVAEPCIDVPAPSKKHFSATKFFGHLFHPFMIRF